MQLYVVGAAGSVLIREVPCIDGDLYREIPLYVCIGRGDCQSYQLRHPKLVPELRKMAAEYGQWGTNACRI